jgi:hypothetical protein
MTYNSIMKCDVDIRKDLYANVVISGGVSVSASASVSASVSVSVSVCVALLRHIYMSYAVNT